MNPSSTLKNNPFYTSTQGNSTSLLNNQAVPFSHNSSFGYGNNNSTIGPTNNLNLNNQSSNNFTSNNLLNPNINLKNDNVLTTNTSNPLNNNRVGVSSNNFNSGLSNNLNQSNIINSNPINLNINKETNSTNFQNPIGNSNSSLMNNMTNSNTNSTVNNFNSSLNNLNNPINKLNMSNNNLGLINNNSGLNSNNILSNPLNNSNMSFNPLSNNTSSNQLLSTPNVQNQLLNNNLKLNLNNTSTNTTTNNNPLSNNVNKTLNFTTPSILNLGLTNNNSTNNTTGFTSNNLLLNNTSNPVLKSSTELNNSNKNDDKFKLNQLTTLNNDSVSNVNNNITSTINPPMKNNEQDIVSLNNINNLNIIEINDNKKEKLTSKPVERIASNESKEFLTEFDKNYILNRSLIDHLKIWESSINNQQIRFNSQCKESSLYETTLKENLNKIAQTSNINNEAINTSKQLKNKIKDLEVQRDLSSKIINEQVEYIYQLCPSLGLGSEYFMNNMERNNNSQFKEILELFNRIESINKSADHCENILNESEKSLSSSYKNQFQTTESLSTQEENPEGFSVVNEINGIHRVITNSINLNTQIQELIDEISNIR